MLVSPEPTGRKSIAAHDGLHLRTGLVFDEIGDKLTPTHANHHGKRYRYYVSRRVMHSPDGRKKQGWRLPAPTLEKAVLDRLNQFLRSGLQLVEMTRSLNVEKFDHQAAIAYAKDLAEKLEAPSPDTRRATIQKLIVRIEIGSDMLSIEIDPATILNHGTTEGTSATPSSASTTHWKHHSTSGAGVWKPG